MFTVLVLLYIAYLVLTPRVSSSGAAFYGASRDRNQPPVCIVSKIPTHRIGIGALQIHQEI